MSNIVPATGHSATDAVLAIIGSGIIGSAITLMFKLGGPYKSFEKLEKSVKALGKGLERFGKF